MMIAAALVSIPPPPPPVRAAHSAFMARTREGLQVGSASLPPSHRPSAITTHALRVDGVVFCCGYSCV